MTPALAKTVCRLTSVTTASSVAPVARPACTSLSGARTARWPLASSVSVCVSVTVALGSRSNSSHHQPHAPTVNPSMLGIAEAHGSNGVCLSVQVTRARPIGAPKR